MGNQNVRGDSLLRRHRSDGSRSGSKTKSLNGTTTKSSRHRVGLTPPPNDDSPDVDTLRLPFNVCRHIFKQLSLRDLAQCMLVCKEWRSLIDTCAFWRAYTAYNYDCKIREVETNSALFQWKYFASNCLEEWNNFPNGGQAILQSYIFEPFPDMWRCGVVVPHSLTPPDGNLEIYHNFIHAVDAAQRLYFTIMVHDLGSQLHVCMFQWVRQRLPTCKEVLDIFSASRAIAQHGIDAHELSRTELKASHGLLTSRYGKPRFESRFFTEFVRWTGPRTIVCDSAARAASPTPSFVLTSLADGWCGGLLYGL